jgi:hypothetical protein
MRNTQQNTKRNTEQPIWRNRRPLMSTVLLAAACGFGMSSISSVTHAAESTPPKGNEKGTEKGAEKATDSAQPSAQAKEVQAKFSKAFSGSSTDKKEALRLASSLGKEDDDTAYELLIKGVNDRQVHDIAVMALRARTGLQPTLMNRGTGYPGYPASDDASEWNNWLAARKRDRETQKKIADQEKKLKEIQEQEKKKAEEAKAGEGKPAEGTPTDPAAQAATGDKPAGEDNSVIKAPAHETPSDLGRIDRIIFKNGGSLVCYILSKRTNADGVLQSVRIVHPNNGGEEILSTDLISRIDEDIR